MASCLTREYQSVPWGLGAKQHAADNHIDLDFTYGVIDKCILRAIIGESSLILTSTGMVRTGRTKSARI